MLASSSRLKHAGRLPRGRGPPLRAPRKRERPGCRPVSLHRRRQRRTRCVGTSVAGPWTDSEACQGLARPVVPGLSVIANPTNGGVGDGLQPHHTRTVLLRWEVAVSHAAIAAVLAAEDWTPTERLAALSLASFANAQQIAWPGNRVAAARAGLGRSTYLAARERLVARGLIVLGDQPVGRGRPGTLRLAFAEHGPWWDGEVNAQLLEAVLNYSQARGPARLLLATIAALADPDGCLRACRPRSCSAPQGSRTAHTDGRARRCWPVGSSCLSRTAAGVGGPTAGVSLPPTPATSTLSLRRRGEPRRRLVRGRC